MNILITICARGGSKGVPGKNIRNVAGLPLIAYSIHHANQFAKLFDCDIVLSTEDEEIKEVAGEYGLTSSYVRSKSLAGDKVGKIAVIEDVYKFMSKDKNKAYEYVLDLDVSSPLRNLNDLTEAFKLIKQNDSALNLFSVSEGRKNPYFNMVELDENGMVVISKKMDEIFYSRQKSPKVFEINGSFYFYKKAFFDEGNTSAVIDHKTMLYTIDHLCFDIDNELEFEFMNFVISKNKLDFKFDIFN